MNWKEIAKFACGFEAFHFWLHAYLLATGTSLTAFGITTTPTINAAGIVVNGVVALLLGIYAWQPLSRGGYESLFTARK